MICEEKGGVKGNGWCVGMKVMVVMKCAGGTRSWSIRCSYNE